MKLRSAAIVLATLVSISDSGAQRAEPAATRDPAPDRQVTPAPSRATATRPARPAPWQRVDPNPDKRQYYVYRRYAPPEIGARLERPVTDPGYRELIARRAAAFRSGSRRLRLAIDQDVIIDVGTTRPDDAHTVALVDLDRSPDLRTMVRRELRADERRNYVVPFLASQAVREPGAARKYRSHDSLIVSVAAKDHSRVTVWRLSDGQWQKLSDVLAQDAVTRDPRRLLDRLQMQPEHVYYGGYAHIGIAEVTAQQPSVAPATSQQMMLLREQIAAQAAEPESNVVEVADTIAEPEEETEAAQPATYTAYGETAFCRAYCAAASCTGCCTGVRLGMEAQIGAIAFACHALSDLCPWCHAGCAANTAMMRATAMTQFAGCTTSCSRPVELLVSQGNPRNCPANSTLANCFAAGYSFTSSRRFCSARAIAARAAPATIISDPTAAHISAGVSICNSGPGYLPGLSDCLPWRVRLPKRKPGSPSLRSWPIVPPARPALRYASESRQASLSCGPPGSHTR